MTPIIHSQCDCATPYATTMIMCAVDDQMDANYAAYTVDRVKASKTGVLRWDHPHSSPHALANAQLLWSAFKATGVAPSKVVYDVEGDGMTDPTSPLRTLVDAVVLAPLRQILPGVPAAAYLVTACSAADGALVPEQNGWSGQSDLGGFDLASPQLGGYAPGLLKLNAARAGTSVIGNQFAAPWSMMRLQVNQLRAAIRAGAKLLPWFSPVAGTTLDPTYWCEMVWHLLLTAGEAIWFNGDRQDDTLLTAACAALVAHTGPGEWVKPANASTLISYTNDWVGSTAQLSDGSLVTRCTAKPRAKPTTLSIAGKVVPVAVEDGAGCWRVVPVPTDGTRTSVIVGAK